MAFLARRPAGRWTKAKSRHVDRNEKILDVFGPPKASEKRPKTVRKRPKSIRNHPKTPEIRPKTSEIRAAGRSVG